MSVLEEPDYKWGRNLLASTLFHAIDVNKKHPGNPFSLCGSVLLNIENTIGKSEIPKSVMCTRCLKEFRVRTNRK